MTIRQPLLPSNAKNGNTSHMHLHQHHQHRNHSNYSMTFRLAIIITCFGIVTVCIAQYKSVAKHPEIMTSSAGVSSIISKDDYISESVVEFRREIPPRRDDDDESNIEDRLEKDSMHSIEGAPQKKNGNNDDDGDEKADEAEPGLEYNGTPLHVVFSTSCSDQMHWESFVFFYHAYKVKQPGTVTRIASGCNDEEAEEARKFHQASIATMSSRFHLHLTPDFSKQRLHDNAKSSYKYMNKPFGLRDWLEGALAMNATKDDPRRVEGVEDGVVILMDPDMVLLRPILHDFSKEDVIYAEEHPATTIVTHGKPMAQQDGYLDNKWMHINGSFITGDPNIGRPKDRSGPLNWNTGPPYLATVKDMYDISLLWTDYAPRVDHVNPGLFAEMQGYIWATYKLGLPHTLIKSIVVSNTETPHREGWSYVDALPNDQVCDPPPTANLPIGLHYCGRYAVGPDFFFSKYRLKKNFLSCEKNLMMPPPRDIGTQYDFFIAPPPASGKPPKEPEKKTFSKKRVKREAFMMCGLIDSVNEAATYYKKHNCGDMANYNKVYTIKNDPGRY